MSLAASLSIANGGLNNINAQLGLVSNNVANASTPDYSVETASQESIVGGGQPLGVHTEASTRAIDLALQQAAFQQDTVVSGLTTTTASLQQLDALQGAPGQGNDLGSLLGKVQSCFSTLLGNPSSTAQQTAVISAAGTLTGAINTLSNGYTQQRQAAQNDIITQVSNLNTDLNQIGMLSNQIVAAQVSGLSPATLENQRDAVVHSLSNIIGIKTLTQPDGDMIVTTTSGTELPTRGNANPIQTSGATIGSGASYAGGSIPAITLRGLDITSQLQGGSLGADITLRDSTLPTFQGELDEFSYSLASQFSAQGLTLFSDPNGNVPAGGGPPVQSTYVGFASEIQVNPAVTATPSLVRDGTQNIAGSAAGASAFTTNPAGGPAGFTTLINRVLNYALGADAQAGVPQLASNTSGLGPDGTLNAPYTAPPTLAANAAALVSAQAGVSTAATGQLSSEQALQTTLNANVTAVSGVNMDTEMSTMIELENAYGANARIIAAVQAMFTQLLQVVQSSSTISGIGFPQLGQLAAELTRTKMNFDTLTQQASSGMISNTYAGLRSYTGVALGLSPEIDSLTTAQGNIAAASGPAQVTQTAMTQISSIAASLLADMPALEGVDLSEVDNVAANARSALAQVADLLDSQYNGVYVFAGQDSANPPVPNPEQITTSGFYTQISATVTNLTVNGAAATAAATLVIAASTTAGTSPLSATYLAQPAASLTPPLVATGDGVSQPLGLLAGSNIGPVSTGNSTTGSYMLDLLRALATVGSLSSSQTTDPNFAALVSDTQTSVTGAITAMNTDVGILGEQQSSLTTLSTTLSDTQTVLAGQLSTAQNVDMASTLSNLSLMQTQLTESYQLISAASGMSLAKFLPVS